MSFRPLPTILFPVDRDFLIDPFLTVVLDHFYRCYEGSSSEEPHSFQDPKSMVRVSKKWKFFSGLLVAVLKVDQHRNSNEL